MGKYEFDVSAAMARINGIVETGIDTTLDEIVDIAQSLAPVRKETRRKTKSVAIGGYRTKHTAALGGKRYANITGSELATAFERLTGKKMTRADRSAFGNLKIGNRSKNRRAVSRAELDAKKSSSGTHRRFTVAHEKGGTLKHGIEATDVETNGNVISGSVVSTAPYSRYVEFPTSRTAAQPFLLPAFKVARSKLKANIKAAARGG